MLSLLICLVPAFVTAYTHTNLRGNEEADYIIVGAGTAGNVLAAKLARAGKSVILLEAGPDDDWKGKNLLNVDVDVFVGNGNFDQHTAPEISTWHWFEPYIEPRPSGFEKLNKYGGFDGGFYAMEVFFAQAANSPKIPIPNDWNRRTVSVAAKIVGGCSAHNFFMWLEPSDQSLSKLGPGWEPQVLKPKYDELTAKYMKTHKNAFVERASAQQTFQGFIKHGGCKIVAGSRNIANSMEKCAISDVDKSMDAAGRRISSGSAFLTKEVRSLPNFQLRVNSQVKRVLFDGTKAIGVEYIDGNNNGAVRTVKAKQEIVLSAGVYVSPQLLMLSGIGPKITLDRFNIPIVAELPVGADYHDHPLFIMAFHVPLPTAMDKSEPEIITAWVASFRSSFVKGTDEWDICITPTNAIHLGDNMYRFEIGILLYSRIKNRGTVSLRSNSIKDLPQINYSILKEKVDMDRAVEAMDFVRDVMKKMTATEVLPGKSTDDRDYVRKTAFLVWHGVGTNSIGQVVDQQLRVKGVSNLRVADNSIVNEIPNSNTQSIAYMIGYHGADIILGKQPFAWKVTYPSCTRGYWASGCGQPATKQKGTAKCYGMSAGKTWADEDKMCAGAGPKPAATERTCPATKPCPRCRGCKRDGSCWKACGNKAGMCSACDSNGDRMGACCMPGADTDPVECQLVEWQFQAKNTHTCALLPEDKHMGNLLKSIVGRLGDLEKSVGSLAKAPMPATS